MINIPQEALAYLSEKDAVLKYLIDKYPIPQKESYVSLFQGMLHAVVGQQISQQAQEAIWGRLKSTYDLKYPEAILKADIDQLRDIGLSYRKATYVKAIANYFQNNPHPKFKDQEDMHKALERLPGIGSWTVEMVRLFALNDLSTFSLKDLGLRKAIELLYQVDVDDNVMYLWKKRYGQWGGVAAFYLWDYGKREMVSKTFVSEAIFSTPLGNMYAKVSEKGLIRLTFTSEKATYKKDNIPSYHPLLHILEDELMRYLSGSLKEFSLPIYYHGTIFQKEVWRKVASVSYGVTRSYSDIAQSLGKPKAARAIGQALKKNPILIVCPCHRIFGKNGQLTGYVAGSDKKEKLLKLEGSI